MTGRRSNQLNYAPERREIVAARCAARGGRRACGQTAEGEPRRLDRGGRDRARRDQRLPARAPDRSAVARGARGRRARRGALRTRDRRWREPVRAARRARRRGDRRHARADGRRVHRPLGARADLDPAAAALARLGGRERARTVHRPRDLLGRRRDAPLPSRPDGGPPTGPGVARGLCAHAGAAARDGHGRGRAHRPVRRDRRPRRRSRSARSRDPAGRRRSRGAAVGRSHHRLRLRARRRGIGVDRGEGAGRHERARRRRHRPAGGRPPGRPRLRGPGGLLRRGQRRRDPPRSGPAGDAARHGRSRARPARRAARVPGQRPVSRDARADGARGEGRAPGRLRPVPARTDGHRAPGKRRGRKLGRPGRGQRGQGHRDDLRGPRGVGRRLRGAEREGCERPGRTPGRRSRRPASRADL